MDDSSSSQCFSIPLIHERRFPGGSVTRNCNHATWRKTDGINLPEINGNSNEGKSNRGLLGWVRSIPREVYSSALREHKRDQVVNQVELMPAIPSRPNVERLSREQQLLSFSKSYAALQQCAYGANLRSESNERLLEERAESEVGRPATAADRSSDPFKLTIREETERRRIRLAPARLKIRWKRAS